MIEFALPSLGSDMDEGTITDWLVKPGDEVTRGQVVAVVDTTKAAVEVECWHDGIVHEILVPEGETISVGTVLATLLAPGENPPEAQTPTPQTEVPETVAPQTETPETAVPETVIAKTAVPEEPESARQRVSPAARREAAALGVDLATLIGTAPGGAVTLDDVRQAAATAAKKPVDRALQMRASIAAAMGRSKREIPHYYLGEDVVLDRALSWLTEFNSSRPITERLLPAVLQLKAVALAARKYPELNGFWRNDQFEAATGVHVGVAISLRGGGLVAPALHDAADKPLVELMAALTDLVARARAGSLRSSEMSDPTITVTNLGDTGVAEVFGVIYPPQVALVGFGKPTLRPAVVDGLIQPVMAVTASLSADHRASDGHRGAMFLSAIADLLQRPEDL